MHQNYYFLKQLSLQLPLKLVGKQLETCFSQNKDELILGFEGAGEEFFIRALLTSHFSALSFPSDFKRARANSVELFEPVLGQQVEAIVQHQNERSFYLRFTNNFLLLFKLFGNRANVVLYHEHQAIDLFHKKFGADLEMNPLHMDRPLQQNYAAFAAAEGNLRKIYPTFGDLPALYLAQQQYATQPLDEKWEMVQTLLEKLEQPDAYYITKLDGKTRLSLLPLGEVQNTFHNPIDALNDFTRSYLYETGFERQYEQARQHLEKKLNGTRTVLAQTELKLQELRHDRSYSQTADVLMANLTNIPPRAAEVELYDFYTDKNRSYKLKPDETPQKQAERLYRKAKNQHLEVKQLEEKAERKLEETIVLEDALAAIEAVDGFKSLKLFLREYAHILAGKQQAQPEIPFRLFESEGFKILVGKSARNNDVLTQKHAHKDDLWLHAKDVSGSHVVIKHQAGKTVPATVLEKAAQLAAYYSKRKTDSLCPVLYTPKKFVRKPKGSAPGSVVVEREKVLLVKPENPFERNR
ncbi:DUF814 domain-containing protein [Pontibacter qinzhouensis]|uniref:DUF814 domain-containing protein n=1 Tax=Pontibacter qinzhouensis TaxID=2603253 RepID=A0A5C8INH4_9BACT|nr:NFACT RNA binding domain-containing protein [Pontibacter qinzhouensis]TXK22566.1 DUF814 domain-containing protein [Pontibacter qinzhouensis]